MRQAWKDRRRALHRSALPMSRMMTMVLLLAIMGVMFVIMGDPSRWRLFARGSDADTQRVGDNDTPLVIRPAPRTPADSTKPALQKRAASSAASAVGTPNAPVPNAPVQKAPAASVPAVSAPAASPPAVPDHTVLPDRIVPAEPTGMVATGPTDLDPLEQEEIQSAISVIEDGSLAASKYDMPAYFQILDWVDHQSTELLRKRAKRDVTYSDFRMTPGTMRLQIVDIKLSVRQIIRLTNPPENGMTTPMTTREGHPIYEVRGFTEEGGSNLYFGFVTDLPKGMPYGININEDARLVGYFFKLQGYESQAQLLEAEQYRRRPVALTAPVILGRLVWTNPSPLVEAQAPFWLLVGIVSAGIVIVVGWVGWSMRRKRPSVLSPTASNQDWDAEGPSVDHWLNQAQTGRLGFDRLDGMFDDQNSPEEGIGGRFSGNNTWGNGESKNGHAHRNGHDRSRDEGQSHGEGHHDEGRGDRYDEGNFGPEVPDRDA
jgi:hypothetical protein